MITPYNILHHEFIGLDARVVGSGDSGRVGLAGQVTDETKSTVTLSGESKIPKEGTKFQLQLPDKAVVEVEGRLLLGRPEERIKKRIRIRF
ncbi:MAG: ribonuclease P protein component 1 [Candidatus Altiarchaeota archaeon]